MICHTKSPPARSALNFNATSHSLGQASREPDHGLAGKSWYTRYHRDVDVVSSELSGNAKYVMWIVCRCGNTTIHHNYNFLYHLGVVICDGYEDLCTIPNWDLPTALYHWDYRQLVPISWLRYTYMPSFRLVTVRWNALWTRGWKQNFACSFQWVPGIVHTLSWEEAGARDVNHLVLGWRLGLILNM